MEPQRRQYVWADSLLAPFFTEAAYARIVAARPGLTLAIIVNPFAGVLASPIRTYLFRFSHSLSVRLRVLVSYPPQVACVTHFI